MNIQKPFWHKSIRLKEFDYTQSGSYFITICSHDNQCLFGSVSNEQMHLNAFGEIVAREWAMTGNIRPNVTIDEFIVMPNHIHAIIGLADEPSGTQQRAATGGTGIGTQQRAATGGTGIGTQQRAATEEAFGKPVSNSIPTIIRGFKAATTVLINRLRNPPRAKVWQRNYYEHVIGNEEELTRLREYLRYNASKWSVDSRNPENIGTVSRK